MSVLMRFVRNSNGLKSSTRKYEEKMFLFDLKALLGSSPPPRTAPRPTALTLPEADTTILREYNKEESVL